LRRRFLSIGVIVAALAGAPQAAASLNRTQPHTDAAVPGRAALVQLSTPGAALSPALRAADARLVDPTLNVWRIPARTATGAVTALRAEHVLAHAEQDQRLVSFTHLSAGDPLLPDEWWIHDVGDDRAEPPGPGVPLTVVDTGVDLTHPEFAGRPNTVALNQQFVVSQDDFHGTAVSSVAAAPANGQGLVGMYPQALLQEWDFGDGSLSDILGGLNAASKRSRGVINFSGGFLDYSALLEQAIDRALKRGSVVVAAVGNDRQTGNRSFVPASLPHVLTVGANTPNDHVAPFSNRSSALDLVAPGVAMPVAVPAVFRPSGYASFDGTSFSAPLVSAAAAWIWTLRPRLDPTQVEDVMRDSARDVGRRGWDADTGFGILNVPAALARPVRARDPQEPNDDINLVRPHAVTAGGTKLAIPASFVARMGAAEDPEDVYRVWVPAGRKIAARTGSRQNVDLALWGPKTKSVYERGKAQKRDLLAFSRHPGTRSDVVSGQNKATNGAYFFVDVFLGKRVRGATYNLRVSVARR
jgi:subtilisin family serine protease